MTPYLANVRAAGIPVTIAVEPEAPPDGWEVVVSTAFAGRLEGKTRAEFLTELIGRQRSIVVGGAHGKTTTAGMIAFVLDRVGLDPGFLIGGEIPQLGGNARAGGGWLVVEGDESDRTVFQLPAEIAVVTNVDLDHHATFASAAELDQLFARWTSKAPHVVDGRDLAPAELDLAVAGEHNRLNASCALAALELAGVERGEAERVLVEFRGAGRRQQDHGETAGVRLIDDYGHHPAEVAATLTAARDLVGEGRLLVLFQPHLYSRTVHLQRELGAALAAADIACVTEIYPAREEPLAGVSGKLVLDRLTEIRPGMPVAWTPTVEDGAAILARLAREGDLILTLGAGDVDRAQPLLAESLRS